MKSKAPDCVRCGKPIYDRSVNAELHRSCRERVYSVRARPPVETRLPKARVAAVRAVLVKASESFWSKNWPEVPIGLTKNERIAKGLVETFNK